MEEQNTESNGLIYLIAETKGWLKFLGIISIINGILYFISVFGIIIAWLPLWQGFLLLHSANKAEDYVNNKDEMQLKASLKPIKTYFIIQSVLMALAIISVVIAWVVIFSTGMWMKMGLKTFLQ